MQTSPISPKLSSYQARLCAPTAASVRASVSSCDVVEKVVLTGSVVRPQPCSQPPEF
jgi:hypothetical protein